jgi:hypothetical protein
LHRKRVSCAAVTSAALRRWPEVQRAGGPVSATRQPWQLAAADKVRPVTTSASVALAGVTVRGAERDIGAMASGRRRARS